MKLIEAVSRSLAIAASLVLGALMLLTVADVTLRWLLNHPIIGTTEITESMMACIAFFALAWCAAEKSHLKVDMLIDRFSPRIQGVMDSVTTLAGLCFVALIGWRSLLEGIAVWQLKQTSSLIKIPIYPFYYVIAAGCTMLCLVMASQLVEHLIKAVRK
ncbi:MAG: TRAP transporter small permease [Desulfobacteraceae bacterium]|nr:TRAP transporter small permease [Desulfobacteraceae bacterium]